MPPLPFTVLARALMAGGSAPAPTTVQFTYAQASGSITGQKDILRTAGRTYLGAGVSTALVLYIKGTDASVFITHNTAGFGTGAGLVECYIDDGAKVTPVGVGGKFPLFTGLSDTLHKVVIAIGGIYGNNAYILQSNPLIEATGAPPSISFSPSWVTRSSSEGSVWTSCTYQALTANYTPNPTVSGSALGSKTACVKVRADTTYLDVVTQGTHFGVSIDGASPTYYATGKAAWTPSVTRITTTAGEKDYYVWATVTGNATAISNIQVGTSSAPVSTAATKLHQVGDSITNGNTGGSNHEAITDVQPVAAALGFVGANIGVSGWTSAQLAANIAAMSATWGGNVAQDVAVIAIGRNDTGAFSTHQANFVAIKDQLLTLYKTVLVRGVLETGTSFTTFNADMSAWVTSLADADVIYIDPESWTGISTLDGVHPDPAGYATIAAYAKPAYQAALGL